MNEMSSPPEMPAPAILWEHSPSGIEALVTSLAVAQAKGLKAEFNQVNPAFKRGNEPSRYADLASIMATFAEKVATEGFALIQLPSTNANEVSVRTVLAHKTGQWVACVLSAKAENATPQKIGGALTYMKRYGASTITGIVADDDDDGNLASGTREPPPRRRPYGYASSDGDTIYVDSSDLFVSQWLTRIRMLAENRNTKTLRDIWAKNGEELAITRREDRPAVERIERAYIAALDAGTQTQAAAEKPPAEAKPEAAPAEAPAETTPPATPEPGPDLAPMPEPAEDAIPYRDPDGNVHIAKGDKGASAPRKWVNWLTRGAESFKQEGQVTAFNAWADGNDAGLQFLHRTVPEAGKAAADVLSRNLKRLNQSA